MGTAPTVHYMPCIVSAAADCNFEYSGLRCLHCTQQQQQSDIHMHTATLAAGMLVAWGTATLWLACRCVVTIASMRVGDCLLPLAVLASPPWASVAVMGKGSVTTAADGFIAVHDPALLWRWLRCTVAHWAAALR